MKPGKNVRFIRNLCGMAGLLSLIAAIVFWYGWEEDNRRLRIFAAPVLDGHDTIDGAAIEALTGLVYSKGGFAQNKSRFLWSNLGPTPAQIMDEGGDCSDKSRLVAAILSEYGIDTSLVMLAPCAGCAFGHTVFEAKTNHGPVVGDPVYNIVFPAGDGRYNGVHDLKGDAAILQDRLTTLIEERGAEDKIAFYRSSADGAHYAFPKTINLEKNIVTRITKAVLSLLWEEPELLYRPRFLEDPKLFLTLAAAGAAASFFTLFGLLHWVAKRTSL